MYIGLIVIIDSGWQSFALDKSWFSSSGFLLVHRFATTRFYPLLKTSGILQILSPGIRLLHNFRLDLWQSFESQIEFPDWPKLLTTTRVPSGSWRGQWWKTFTTTQAGCFQTRWLEFFLTIICCQHGHYLSEFKQVCRMPLDKENLLSSNGWSGMGDTP